MLFVAIFIHCEQSLRFANRVIIVFMCIILFDSTPVLCT